MNMGTTQNKQRVLFLSRWFPYPPDNGSKIRIYNLLRNLSKRFTVDLLSFYSEEVTEEQAEALEKICDYVCYQKYEGYKPSNWKALLGYFSNKPRFLVQTTSQRMLTGVRGMVSANNYQAVIASQIDMIPYLAVAGKSKKIVEELELTAFYEQASRESGGIKRLTKRLMWWKLASYLRGRMQELDGITVVSSKELDLLKLVNPEYETMRVVQNGVDFSYYDGFTEEGEYEQPTLIFNGALSFYANYDAMHYFLSEVFPKVRVKIPEARILITGKTNNVKLDGFPKPEGVVFTGYLEDIRPAVAKSWVSVIPLRLGGGTRLKILEAMALKTPVVSTSKGAEGLSVTPEKDIWIADEPKVFAKKVVELLSDKDRRKAVSENAYSKIRDQYDWQISGAILNEFIYSLVN